MEKVKKLINMLYDEINMAPESEDEMDMEDGMEEMSEVSDMSEMGKSKKKGLFSGMRNK